MRRQAHKIKNEEQWVYYGFRTTPHGLMLVAATERGVCRMVLGSSEYTLAEELSECFPKAELICDEGDFEEWFDMAAEAVEAPERHEDLPLDIHGTAFQERVWHEIRKIPAGKTKSYSDVARAVGKPLAVRAVASVCTNNPLTMIIPCHRVVGKDGKVHGSYHGVKRKGDILECEKAGKDNMPSSRRRPG